MSLNINESLTDLSVIVAFIRAASFCQQKVKKLPRITKSHPKEHLTTPRLAIGTEHDSAYIVHMCHLA